MKITATMRILKLFGVVAVFCSVASMSAAADFQRALPGQSVGMGPIPVNWNKLTMTVELPDPFNQVMLIMHRREKEGETAITAMTLVVNDHKIVVPKDLLKGLVMADDPEFTYLIKDKEDGRLSSFYIDFEYGYPLKGGTSLCRPSDCSAYRVAIFAIDSNYHVTREKDGVVPRGQIHVPPVDQRE